MQAGQNLLASENRNNNSNNNNNNNNNDNNKIPSNNLKNVNLRLLKSGKAYNRISCFCEATA